MGSTVDWYGGEQYRTGRSFYFAASKMSPASSGRILAPIMIFVGIFVLVGSFSSDWDGGSEGSLCGSTEAEPSPRPSDWGEYGCLPQEATRSWGACLARREYTTHRGQGCPGEERCCPPLSPSGPRGSMCGVGTGPSSDITNWKDYVCVGRDETPNWSACLAREAYSNRLNTGCPGDERCCPPP